MNDVQPEDREQRLRDAVVAGHAWAWAELYDASYDALWGYVYWRTGRVREWTEEAVQSTWLVAVRRIRSFRGHTGGFIGWLRGIADNVVKSELRRWLREEKARRKLEARNNAQEPADRSILQREQALGVARALALLSTDYERILRAKYFDERSVIDIANEEGVTAKAVESRLARARSAFSDAYRRFVDSEITTATRNTLPERLMEAGDG